jgi:hypothetical protein
MNALEQLASQEKSDWRLQSTRVRVLENHIVNPPNSPALISIPGPILLTANT